MSALIDLTGQRFGRLVVLYRVMPNKGSNAAWHCKCDCGNEIDAWGSALRSEHTKSCGCLREDTAKAIMTVHGKRKTRLYRIWLNMKNRCGNPNYHHYERYGGREISVCDEWRNNFEAFYNWSMSNGYSDNLSIDRVDNDKGYSPDNCKWATSAEQSNNLSTNRTVAFNGVERNVAQWCIELKISRNTVNFRLQHGWTIEEALGLVPKAK